MKIELYKISEVHQHRYYKVPKDLFDSERYKLTLNSDAKLLYALLLDRMELSKENGWVNERMEIYLIYTRDALCEMLGLCRNTMTKAFKQLSDTGLIFEKRQGRGLPNLIFIGKIQRTDAQNPQHQNSGQPLDSQNLRIKKRKNCESRIPKNKLQDSQYLRTIETDINDTDLNETKKSQSVSKADFLNDRQTNNSSGLLGIYNPDKHPSQKSSDVHELESILECCELHVFNENNIRLMFQHALEIMYFSEFVKVGTAKIPQCMVRSRMHSLHGAILSYAFEKVKTRTGNISEIKNSTNYLITAIYNATSEYHSDTALDPGLNQYLNTGKNQTYNLWEGG